jgi:hypothetical protein
LWKKNLLMHSATKIVPPKGIWLSTFYLAQQLNGFRIPNGKWWVIPLLPLHAVGLSFYIRRCHWRRVGLSFIPSFSFPFFCWQQSRKKKTKQKTRKKRRETDAFFCGFSHSSLLYSYFHK